MKTKFLVVYLANICNRDEDEQGLIFDSWYDTLEGAESRISSSNYNQKTAIILETKVVWSW